MNLEENLRFVKQRGAQMEAREYLFLGSNNAYVVAVSRRLVDFYDKTTLQIEKKLAQKKDVISADLFGSVLVIVSQSEVQVVDMSDLTTRSFSVPGVIDVKVTGHVLLVRTEKTVLVFRRGDGDYAFASEAKGACEVKKEAVIFEHSAWYFPPVANDATMMQDAKEVISESGVVDVVSCCGRVVVTRDHLNINNKRVSHSMGTEVLGATFGVFAVFARKLDTMFYLVSEDEVELDNESSMVHCRQENGKPMGVALICSNDKSLYFLDEEHYLNVFDVKGIELDKGEETRVSTSMFNIDHSGFISAKKAESVEPKSENDGAGHCVRTNSDIPTFENDSRAAVKNHENNVNKPLVFKESAAAGTSPLKRDPDTARNTEYIADMTKDLQDIVAKVRDIKIRAQHIKLFKYYESADLYDTNSHVYAKIKNAERMREDIVNGTFVSGMCADLDLLHYRILSATVIEESAIQSNLIYIDSKILGETGLRRPIHYTKPLLAKNVYVRRYTDQASVEPFADLEENEGGLAEIDDVRNFAERDDSVVDLQNLKIADNSVASLHNTVSTAIRTPPVDVADPISDAAAKSFAPDVAKERTWDTFEPRALFASVAKPVESVFSASSPATKPAPSIFTPPAPTNLFGQPQQTPAPGLFNFQGTQSTGLFSQAIQTNPFEAFRMPDVGGQKSSDEGKSKSALSKFSDQMGSFFGSTQ